MSISMKLIPPHRPSWQGVLALIAVAAGARLLPHLPANFSPVGAMGLYAGAMLPGPWALAVSLTGLFLSDLVIGLYHPLTMLFVYAGLAANVGLGLIVGRRQSGLAGTIIAAFMGAIIFFILSNFGVWLAGEMYPLTTEGLRACYIAAIPFFGNTLTSQLLFSLVLFGAHRVMGFSAFRPQSRERA